MLFFFNIAQSQLRQVGIQVAYKRKNIQYKIRRARDRTRALKIILRNLGFIWKATKLLRRVEKLFSRLFFFQSSYGFIAKLSERYRAAPYTPCPSPCIASSSTYTASHSAYEKGEEKEATRTGDLLDLKSREKAKLVNEMGKLEEKQINNEFPSNMLSWKQRQITENCHFSS